MVQPGRQRHSHLVQRVGINNDVGCRVRRHEARHQLTGIGNPIIRDDPHRHPACAQGLVVQLWSS
jgi:hypothetical protein